MALSRRTGQRFQGSIWPGFVDAMTGLLLVLMFVLTIFMVVQFVLRETITGQASKLDQLSAEVTALASALGLEERKNSQLEAQMGALNTTLSDTQSDLQAARETLNSQSALITSLTAERDQQAAALDQAQTRITGFEAQVAALLANQDRAQDAIAVLERETADLQAERGALLSQQEALNLALAQTRDEVDAQVEAARLAAAQREAMEALIADFERREGALAGQVTDLETRLSEEEAARLAQAAAAQALRDRLQNADAELTAMTLALEAQRQEAEDTLTLLAAAEAVQEDLDARLAAALADLDAARGRAADQDELRRQLIAALAAQEAAEGSAAQQLDLAEQRAVLLAKARETLSQEQEAASEAQRQTALLNQQVGALRAQLGQLRALLDDYEARDASAQVQLQNLGQDLNAALARAASEERKRRLLEEAERKRLEAEAQVAAAEAEALKAEAKDLERYRSEFFGRLRDVIGGQEGVQVVGDRFVFSSEVLFAPGSANLSIEGQIEIAKIAGILRRISREIPEELDWVIRVDGHTDNVPLSGSGQFADNWELSQARALAVVRYMVNDLALPPERLSANGFGEYQPLNPADTAEARAQNRRIELKLTEK